MLLSFPLYLRDPATAAEKKAEKCRDLTNIRRITPNPLPHHTFMHEEIGHFVDLIETGGSAVMHRMLNHVDNTSTVP